jgi:hypothetical protein
MTPPSPRLLVIGRHTGALPGYEVVETRALVFPTDRAACQVQLDQLLAEARERGCSLVFQAVPGALVAALVLAGIEAGRWDLGGALGLGIIISRPDPAARVARNLGVLDPDQFALVQAANPNARRDAAGAVVVDPPMPFVFDRIEWV